jgi:hypothetical protein
VGCRGADANARSITSLCENCLCPLADARGSVTTIAESAAYGAATVRKRASPGFFTQTLTLSPPVAYRVQFPGGATVRKRALLESGASHG